MSGNCVSASPRVRVREGPSAQEVKEEPADPLSPRPEEVGMVDMLRRHGVNTPDAVHCLRQSGNRVDVALRYAMDMTNTRRENRQTDMARVESEKEKDRAAEQQRQEDKILMVLGEVIPHFPKVRTIHELSYTFAILVTHLPCFCDTTNLVFTRVGYLPNPLQNLSLIRHIDCIHTYSERLGTAVSFRRGEG